MYQAFTLFPWSLGFIFILYLDHKINALFSPDKVAQTSLSITLAFFDSSISAQPANVSAFHLSKYNFNFPQYAYESLLKILCYILVAAIPRAKILNACLSLLIFLLPTILPAEVSNKVLFSSSLVPFATADFHFQRLKDLSISKLAHRIILYTAFEIIDSGFQISFDQKVLNHISLSFSLCFFKYNLIMKKALILFPCSLSSSSEH